MTVHKTKMMKRVTTMVACMLAIVFASTLLCANPAVAAEAANLALNKTAVADSEEADTVVAAKAVDGSDSTRWGSAEDSAGGAHWIYVDLGSSKTVKKATVKWESYKATGYKIQYATGNTAPAADSSDWKDVHSSSDRPASLADEITFSSPVKGRFFRLYITGFTSHDPNGAAVDWPTIAVNEFVLYGDETVAPSTQDPQQNVARGVNATADSVEANTLGAAKAVDGNTTSSSSRWASAVDATASRDGGPHWIYVDLGQQRDVKCVRVFWEMRKAKGYKIQIANGDSAPAADSSDWQTVYTNDGHPSSKTDLITLGKVYQARFVRLYIDHNTYADPDGGVAWGNVSIFELEVYGGTPKMDMNGLADAIKVEAPKKGDTQLKVTLPASDEYDVTYNGTDYEQVVGAQANDGTIPIHQPIVDTQVKVSFKVTKKSDKNTYTFKEVPVTVPGKFQVEAGDNAAPEVLPQLREWKGRSGSFAPSAQTRVVYDSDDFKTAADELAADYKDLFGSELTVVKGSAANAGDIFLSKTSDKSLGLQDEGYLMEITDSVSVKAETKTGAYWSTRTILQALKTGNGSIPQGITRDYPLYKVRGLILDVGRKTFSLDWLKQMSKQLSWFKLNDFQVHLSDNYIWVEEYSDDTVNTAYNGFRLESDIKKGGNDGKNKADLTSTDMWYSKADFREFIQHSRDLGVNIVPEFDMPAHSLALTNVRPDLRTPKSMTRRGNDHLNLAGKYDESLTFALSIWDEYLTGSNPVFDNQTMVHIGADEYEADGNAYRNFVNDLFKHMEDSGRTARVWGSLTWIKGSVDVQGKGAAGQHRQMNLWSAGWAKMDEMYNLGFDLINCIDSRYYIVPNAGYYFDYLNDNTIYNSAINNYNNVTIPAGDEQMIGGAFAVWNDMCGKKENGISEYDVYDRITNSAGLYAAATWGKGTADVSAAKTTAKKLGDAPNTNFGYKTTANAEGTVMQLGMDDANDASGNGNSLNLKSAKNAEVVDVDFKKALELKGGKSYVALDSDLETAGLGNDLRVKVKRTDATSDKDQILFESPYGSIKAVQAKTGKVGITRENHDYSFNYTLPMNEWVELEFKNEGMGKVSLYVNGELKETTGRDGNNKLKATCMFPVKRIGSKTNAFTGYVDDVRLTRNATFATTMPLDNAELKARSVLAAGADDAELEKLVERARALVNQVNPNAAEIANLAQQINDRVANVKYKPADYRKLDALLAAIPSDLSVYTDESVAALTSARNSIQRDLPVSMQNTVDAYTKTLTEAIEGLELKSADNNFAQGVTATACSEEKTGETAPNGPAAAAVDGDESSFWHSKWSAPADNTMPHWFNVKLAAPAKVSGMVYVPRTGSSNGRLTKYHVEVSTDGGSTYTKVAEGTLESSAGAKNIAFDKPVAAATDVKLYFDETDGDSAANRNKFATAGEIRVRVIDETVDLDGLAALIEQAEGLDKNSYTTATWKKLESALADAKDVAASDNPTFEAVNDAKAKLRSAMLGLRPGTPDPVTPDPDKPNPDKPNPDKPNPDKPNPDKPSPDKPGASDGGNGGSGTAGSNKGDSTTGNKGNKKPGTLVKTGDDQAMYIAAAGVVGLLVVGAGVVLYVKNRRR